MGPLKEGYGAAEEVAADPRATALKISGAATLRDLAKDYAIFSHGAFFVHGKLDVDPVADFVLKHPDAGCEAMPTTFPRRIFHGLSAPGRRIGPDFDWSSTLIFVEHRYWEDLKAHLMCCGWVDRRRKLYARAVLQVIPIVDFLALARGTILPTPLPTVEVAVFGVDGTHAHVQFKPRVAAHDDAATAVHLPLVEETRTLGRALLSCAPRPFSFIESEDPYVGIPGSQGIVLPPS